MKRSMILGADADEDWGIACTSGFTSGADSGLIGTGSETMSDGIDPCTLVSGIAASGIVDLVGMAVGVSASSYEVGWGGVTNFDVTAFLASGVLGPAVDLARGVPAPVLTAVRDLREAVGGGVTSSSPPLILRLSLKVILDPDPELEVDMPCGVLVTEGGKAVVSGVAPIVSK